jgi:hypothetical protein
MDVSATLETMMALVIVGYLVTGVVSLFEGTLTQEKLAMRAWVTTVLTFPAGGERLVLVFWVSLALTLAIVSIFRKGAK